MTSQDIIARAAEEYQALNEEELVAAGVFERDAHFVPIIAYPAMSMMQAASASQLLPDPLRLRGPAAIYVHVPFCITRCLFCHWVIKTGSDEDEVMRYLRCLDAEFTMYRERLGVEKIPASSILIGGGTPSLLEPAQLEHFLQLLHRHLDLSRCRQFSYEAEPSTLLGEVGDARLSLMRSYGVQRVSMGVQAFDDALLKVNARHHTSAQALEAISKIHAAGINSVSIDLIYGLTGQTLESWIDTMNTAIRSGADAWQLYRLRILPHGDKPGKVLDHFKKNPSRYVGVEDALLMKQIGIDLSEGAGFSQRYTRIFARGPEHLSYYLVDVNHELTDVVGVGISSWGNFDSVYTLNVGDNFPLYHQMVEGGQLPIDRGLVRSRDIDARHDFILQLKNTRVQKQRFERRYQQSVESFFGEPLSRLAGLGLISSDAEHVWLSPRGLFFADQVVTHFCAPEHRPRTRRPDLPPPLLAASPAPM